VGRDIVNKFKGMLGQLLVANFDVLPSVTIKKSTPPHVDCHYNWDGGVEHGSCGPHIGPAGRVGYVFMNDNPDAYFQHGDVSLPVKEGTFISFRGDIPHNTIVNKGTVTLLGPMEMMTDYYHVWGNDSPDCDDGQLCCVPVSESRRHLLVPSVEERKLEPTDDECFLLILW
jgi:hypothetical protein